MNWDTALQDKGWNTFYLGNHDQPRAVSRYGNDQEYREISAKMLATMLFTLKALPFIYQGDELGTTNTPFYTPDEFDDIQARNQYQVHKAKGGSDEEYLAIQNQVSRDHARTPFLWNAEQNAGFTDGTPWLKINPNHTSINAVQAQENQNSVWHFYQTLIKLRKEHELLIYGDFEVLFPEHNQIFAYERANEDAKALILLNFSEEEQELNLNLEGEYKLLLSNYADAESKAISTLRAYESRIYQLV